MHNNTPTHEVYAQINGGVVVNTIVMDTNVDSSTLAMFASGFQFFIRIDNLTPMPSIGDLYQNGVFIPVNPPLPSDPNIVTPTQFPYQMQNSDLIVQVHSAGGPTTVILPDATSLTPPNIIWVNDIDNAAGTNTITVQAAVGQTIDGASSKTITINSGQLQCYTDGGKFYSL